MPIHRNTNMTGNGSIWKMMITVSISVALTLLITFFGISSKWGVRAEKIENLEKRLAEMGSFTERLATVEERLRFSIEENKAAHSSIESKLNILLEKAFARYQITDTDTYQAMYWSEDYVCTLVSGVTYQ